MIKFQSYLAGLAIAGLLAAYIAMELLNAFPVNQYLWHINIIFAREARPLLQHIDMLAGGSSTLAILALGSLALACILAAKARFRLLAAVNCHIALIMLLHLAARSYVRTYPHGLFSHDTVFSLAAKLSVVQFGIAGWILGLTAVCVVSHIDLLRHALARHRTRRIKPETGKPLMTGLRTPRATSDQFDPIPSCQRKPASSRNILAGPTFVLDPSLRWGDGDLAVQSGWKPL